MSVSDVQILEQAEILRRDTLRSLKSNPQQFTYRIVPNICQNVPAN
jgi:hypothetical protein